jgi:signal transduction histidine kinase
LKKKIENLKLDINRFYEKNKTFTQIEMNCKDILQKERLSTISDLLRVLCHEMNQSLQAISGYSDLIKLNLLDSSPITKDIKKIREQINRANNINKKVITIAKFIN